jgi:hypothetical protein
MSDLFEQFGSSSNTTSSDSHGDLLSFSETPAPSAQNDISLLPSSTTTTNSNNTTTDQKQSTQETKSTEETPYMFVLLVSFFSFFFSVPFFSSFLPFLSSIDPVPNSR